jgi:hypothetical protein
MVLVSTSLWGQDRPQASDLSRGSLNVVQRGVGPQLYSLSIFTTGQVLDYSTVNTSVASQSTLSQDWRAQGGISGGAGWIKNWRSSAFNVDYYGAYSRQFTGLPSPQVYHNANLDYSLTAKMAPRWTYNLGVNSNFQNIETYLLNPITQTVALPSGGDFNSLLAALQSGSISTSQFAAQTAGATVVDSRANPVLYGRRVLTDNIRNTFTFAKSPRMSYSFFVGGTRADFFGNPAISSTSSTVVLTPSYLPNTTSVAGGVTIDFTATSRTSYGVNLYANRYFSRLSDAYNATGELYVGHTIKPWWYIQGRAGVGQTVPLNIAQDLTFDPRATGGLMTAFQGYSQTFALDVSVTTADPYAIGTDRSILGTVSWGLHRRRSHWSLFAYGQDAQTRSRTGTTFSNWRATGGLSYVITDNLLLSFSGSYTNYTGNMLSVLGAGSDQSLGLGNNGFRGGTISLTWTPKPLRW